MLTWENFVDLRRLLMVLEDLMLLHKNLTELARMVCFGSRLLGPNRRKLNTHLPLFLQISDKH